MTKEVANTEYAATTGAQPTVAVAVEQSFPDGKRVITDDLAYSILPLSMRLYTRLFRLPGIRGWTINYSDKAFPGVWGGLLIRKRYIDDKMLEAVANQAEAVVNLGAGFDTRAYRFPALRSIPVWELDQAQNIDTKRARLKKIFGEVPDHVKLVAINFEQEDLGAVLASQGYETSMKTFFIWEAVTQYLTESGIRETFDLLSKVSAGSQLAFTYILKDFIDGEVLYGQESAYKEFLVKKKAWCFGFDPENVPNFLSDYGWHMIEDISYEELTERYVKPTGRQLASMEIERMAFAEKL